RRGEPLGRPARGGVLGRGRRRASVPPRHVRAPARRALISGAGPLGRPTGRSGARRAPYRCERAVPRARRTRDQDARPPWTARAPAARLPLGRGAARFLRARVEYMALARAIQGPAQPLGIPPEPRAGVLRARGEPELLRALPARRPACADGPARRRQLLPARRADGLVSAGGRAAALSHGGRSDEPGGDGGT